MNSERKSTGTSSRGREIEIVEGKNEIGFWSEIKPDEIAIVEGRK
ncbi:MAG: hypothetical protein AAB017_03345 [Nitrospirota bacterium]